MSASTTTATDGLSIGVQWDDRTAGGSLTPSLPSFVYNELCPLTTRHLLEATRRRNESHVDIAALNTLVLRDRNRESYVNDAPRHQPLSPFDFPEAEHIVLHENGHRTAAHELTHQSDSLNPRHEIGSVPLYKHTHR